MQTGGANNLTGGGNDSYRWQVRDVVHLDGLSLDDGSALFLPDAIII